MRCFVVLLLVFPFCSFAEINKPLQESLLQMEHEDQSVRKEIEKFVGQKPPNKLLKKAHTIDLENTAKLKSIISQYSWLTKDLVGEKGVRAAFLIIQHSQDLKFQKRMLPYLKSSYLKHEGITGQEVALLTDKLMIRQGKSQIYGTQFDVENAQIIFKPIENIDVVNRLRAEMKMPPLDFYKKLLEKMYGFKEHPEIELN